LISNATALRDFSDNARDADVAIVYFAGHGIEINGSNYLIPVDAVLERDIDAFDEAIPLDRILTVVEPAKQLRLVILDACRDNPFNKSMKRTIASHQGPLLRVHFAGRGPSAPTHGSAALSLGMSVSLIYLCPVCNKLPVPGCGTDLGLHTNSQLRIV
jgi:uncharacterized caspase-like protein